MRVTEWIRRPGLVALAALLGAGCSPPPLRIEPGYGPATPDGLRRVRTTGVGAAYVRPGVRFTRYDAVLIDPLTVAYRSPPRRPSGSDQEPGNYALDRPSMDRLKQVFQREIERELTRRDAFVVRNEAGPGVLRVSGHIVDLVWTVPPARGGETSFVMKTGELTLIFEVRDSYTRERLVRLADRQAILPYGASLGGGYENDPVNNWAAVGAVASQGARILRGALDVLQTELLPPHAPRSR